VTHFVANNQETDRIHIDESISQRALREIYLPPFLAAVRKAHVASTMCAYNQVNGQYSCQSPFLLKTLLYGQWGFQGFVRSDLGAVHNIRAAFDAGMDQLKPGRTSVVAEQIASDKIPMARVNDAVRRVLREMFRFALFTRRPTGGSHAVVTTREHVATALTIAESGMVLLRNNGNTLPLRSTPTQSIAVIGTDGGHGARSRGFGSTFVYGGRVVTPYEAILRRAHASRVTYASGESLEEAQRVARDARVALVFANDFESEGHDRTNLDLPGNQNALINAVARANPNTVVVLNTGSAVVMPWLSQVKAVVEAWYPGQEDGDALAAVLFGDVNPSGKLPITFPESASQTPAHLRSEWPGIHGVATYREGIDVGYRWYQAEHLRPLFPFGYGLSYTTFAVRQPTVVHAADDAITISANITNTGSRPGAEVIQLYAGLPASTGEPPRQLKRFEKVFLQPGQRATVHFTIAASDLSYWGSHGWTVAPGWYPFYVGTSSADVLNAGSIELGPGGNFIGQRASPTAIMETQRRLAQRTEKILTPG
jgi:beta-glucosidase